MDTLRSLLRYEEPRPPAPLLPSPALPLTTSHLHATHRYPLLLSTAATNTAKAKTALQLLQKLDGSLSTHQTSATALRESLRTLTRLRAGVGRAEEAAQKVLGQLLDLERVVREAERERGVEEARALREEVEREDQEYERAEWERVKEVVDGYEEQLEGFRRERVVQGMHAGERVRRTAAVALREVALEDGEGEGLEDFLGEGGGGGRNGGVVKKETKKNAASRKVAARTHVIVDDEDIGDEVDFMDMYKR